MLIFDLTQYRRLCTGMGSVALLFRPVLGYWFGTRTTPIPIFLRMRSGYLSRAFSANFLVLKGFDKMTSSEPLYSNRSHRTVVFIPGIIATSPPLATNKSVRSHLRTKLVAAFLPSFR